jgi:adenosylcobinamide-phosphate synthase
MPSSLLAILAVGLAAVLDRLVGELPDEFHPVAWLGRLVGLLDRDWQRPFAAGTAGAIVLPTGAAVLAWLLVRGSTTVHVWLGATVAGLVLWTTTSLHMLLAETVGVVVASETDPTAARERLPALVGRDPSALTPGQMRSAAVESSAENLADGLVAPLFAFAICLPVSLSLATAAAVWIKAVNTMDSMLGYPEQRVGTASARLDDLVMWLPARLTAVLLALVTGSLRPAFRARESARATASPNAGWPMGTLADATDVRLVKPEAYELNPSAELPDPEQARRAIGTVGRAGFLAYACAIVLSLLLATVQSAVEVIA